MGIKVPWSVLPDYRCFGCSPHNPAGLGLTFTPNPEGVQARFRLDRGFESYPGVVHGGLVGVICDETMGNLIVLDRRRTAFTVSLRTRFVAPLLVDRDYVCVARLHDGPEAPLIHASAEVVDAEGDMCATATATYQPFTLQDVRDQLTLGDDEVALLTQALTANGA
ncbi:PaaI family thioesterase [Actinomadura vinacea]|uniref:PaaI family thioesterase n=1 Tax=Actinomadura vinacea TaxID=115336 RepID=A0ABN3IE89_9ACTN